MNVRDGSVLPDRYGWKADIRCATINIRPARAKAAPALSVISYWLVSSEMWSRAGCDTVSLKVPIQIS